MNLCWLLLLFFGESRLWSVDVELHGPLPVFEWAMPDGVLRMEPGLGEGERRSLQLPLPAQSPLGPRGLQAVPLPELPVHLEGKLDVKGWSAEQPAARLGAEPRGLLARPAPVPSRTAASVRPNDALFWAAALIVLVVAARRKAGAQLVLLGLVFGAILAFLAARRDAPPATVRVLEGDLANGAWLDVRSAVGEISGRFDGIEVEPPGSFLDFTVDLAGNLRVRAMQPGRAGLRITGRTVLARLAPGELPEENLSEVWTRGPEAGAVWIRRGAWPIGDDLPAPLPGASGGKGPPGWLAGGLPSGTGILVARGLGADGAGEVWLRASGFDPESL